MSVEELYNREWKIKYDGVKIIVFDDDFKFVYDEGDCEVFKDKEKVAEIFVEGFGDCEDVVGMYEKVAYLLWNDPPVGL